MVNQWREIYKKHTKSDEGLCEILLPMPIFYEMLVFKKDYMKATFKI